MYNDRGLNFFTLLIIGLFLIAICVPPVSADPSDMVVRGHVSKINHQDNTVSIDTNTSEITGIVPDRDAYDYLWIGENVYAVYSPDSTGRWVSIANFQNPEATGDISGDPRKIPVQFPSNYSVDILVVPDCSRCNGLTCEASYANVSVKQYGKSVSEKMLYPAQNRSGNESIFTYSDKNGFSTVQVAFIAGDTDSGKCLGKNLSVNIRTTQIFEIHYREIYPVMPYSPNNSYLFVVVYIAIILVIGIAFVYRLKRTKIP